MVSATFKPLSMADSCLLSLPSIFNKNSLHQHFLSISNAHIKLQFSRSVASPSISLKTKPNTFFSIIPFVAQTSDWAQQEEEDKEDYTGINIPEGEEIVLDNQLSDEGEGYVEEPPEEAKIFIGNLPYDVDSEKLAMLFEKAGTVEIAEVIYNRETDTSRGFGFVTMRTVEEAEKAVEMFHQYDLQGRLLTVNKAAPKGARPERPLHASEPGYRIYVGNLPWDVDNARLEQVFSEHGKVVDARVVYDRDTGRSRGFGFVTMSTETELNDAIAALDGQSLDGRAIRVNVAEERPRRRSF